MIILYTCTYFTAPPELQILGSVVYSINEGSSLTVSCSAVGIPEPEITWVYNNAPPRFSQTVSSTPLNISIVGQPYVNEYADVDRPVRISTLLISNVEFLRDDGVYHCIGQNAFSGMIYTNTTTFTLNIMGKSIYSTTVKYIFVLFL